MEKTGEVAKLHVQWDPERTLRGAKLSIRTIQVGIGRELIEEFNRDWIVEIADSTPLVRKIHQLKLAGKIKEVKRLLPKEKVYKVDADIEKSLGIQ